MNAFRFGSMKAFFSICFLEGDSFSLSGAYWQFLSLYLGGLFLLYPGVPSSTSGFSTRSL